MPAFDGTGPQGRGPMTGWGMGPCGRNMGRKFGVSFGQGRGFGSGFCRFLSLDEEEKKKILEEKIAFLEERLKATKDALVKLSLGKK